MHELAARSRETARRWDPASRAPMAAARSEAARPYGGNQAALRLSRIGPSRLQSKLEVGAVSDPLEAEADRAAEQVMRMPAQARNRPGDGPSGVVRRMCAECKDELDDKRNVQRKTSGGGAMEGAAPPIVQQTLSRPGQPLDPATRSFFEPRFGADFSSVRLHRDLLAAGSARAIQARAYTFGQHIVLGDGHEPLASESNRHLLAHELAHVVQQGGAGSMVRRATGPAEIGTPEGCETGDPVFTPGPTFRFAVNSDDWLSGADAGLLDFLQTVPAGATFQIDGYASKEGPKDFNANLSAARALKARKLMLAAGVDPSRIVQMVAHGATPGKAADRRSVVIRVLPAAALVQDQAPAPDANKPDAGKQDANKPDNKKPDDKKPDDTRKDETRPDADKGGANAPNTGGAKSPDVNPRLQIQIPIAPASVQIPFKGPGGVDVTPPPGQRSSALDTAYQPNMAFGLNYSFMNSDTGIQLGVFGQIGANVSLYRGNSRPITLQGDHRSFTGLNVQGYLQPAWVFLAPDGWSMALILQPGVGRTVISPVPGIDGLTYTFQGGFQVTRDLVKNRLQLFGQLMIGFNKSRLDEVPAGQSQWQQPQPFFGFAFGIQPLVSLLDYKPKKD